MSGWTYYGPIGGGKAERDMCIPPTKLETVGKRELELLLRARRSSSSSITIPHTRNHNATRMAALRLTKRGLLREPNAFGGPGVGWLYRYNLTERGRTCWLRAKE